MICSDVNVLPQAVLHLSNPEPSQDTHLCKGWALPYNMKIRSSYFTALMIHLSSVTSVEVLLWMRTSEDKVEIAL